MARQKAEERLERAIRDHLDASAYETFLDRVEPDAWEEAIKAEVARPGSGNGLQVALAFVQSLARPKGTLHLSAEGEAAALAKYGKEVEQ